ncbi:unnamed protein product [Aphanomyces euteiches]
MTKVQRELFQQLADDVPHDTKEPKDLTHDEYVIIHHKVVLYEAAKARYQIPDKPRASRNHRMDTEWMERNEDFEDPFFVDDDELRAAKKKVGQMEDKMLGIKKVKVTKAQRKQIEEEAIADNNRRAEELEEQRRSGHDIQNPPYDPQRAKEIEDAWTRGMPPSNHPKSLEVDGHILQKAETHLLNVSDPHDVMYPQDASDPHEENDLHGATDPQDANDPQDATDPQDETARCRDDDLHHVEDLGADLLCKIKLKIDIRDLTEERFQRYIRNIVETRPTMKRATECEIKKALNDVLMKTKGDVNSRLLDFMDQLYTAIKDNCLQQSMEDKDCRKVFIRIAITKIRPLTLQGQVRENYNVDPRRHKLEGLSELIDEQMEIHRSAEELVEKHAMTPVKREIEESFSSSSPSPEPKT